MNFLVFVGISLRKWEIKFIFDVFVYFYVVKFKCLLIYSFIRFFIWSIGFGLGRNGILMVEMRVFVGFVVFLDF